MRSILFIVSMALVSIVAAIPGQVIKRQLVTSTVTADAHPMTFWPLSPLAATATPLSYGSPPTASRVPTGPRSVEAANALADCTSSTITTTTTTTTPTAPTSTGAPPSSTTTTTNTTTGAIASTTICTKIRGQYPASTLPAFCRPALFANAASLGSPGGAAAPRPTAVVTMGANSVPDKVSCCAGCAAYYNCFAWRFVPSYVGTPSPRLPAGFDPWRHGNCEIAYYTGGYTNNNTITNTTTTINGTGDGGGGGGGGGGGEGGVLPSICPNGRLRGVLAGGSLNAGHDPGLDGLYYNGWNEGACGDLGHVLFLGGKDSGIGDGSSLCASSV
ncbi:hypothetical protein SAMD00023353_0702450 [Rosellinia necatrix]|uniref:Uncharacterized protein n=1 Tax=Rosellinia necatrix TaxID=77044 RepID=A0A1S7UM50_ROSNE|nr:hypothetical protein SAMD00023353_0702450 [Rosellinia necatrix]